MDAIRAWKEYGLTSNHMLTSMIRAFAAGVAIVAVFTACSSDPAKVKAQHLERGTKYLAGNKYSEAILEFRNALQVDPNFAPALHALGRAYRGKSWSLDARRVFQRLVELTPDDLAARADLAETLLDLEAWDDARVQAEAIRAKKPDSPQAAYLLGAAVLGKGQPQEALQLLTQALVGGAVTPEMHRSHGDALAQLGRLPEAEAAYRRALSQRPNYAEATLGLAGTLASQGQRKAAIDLLTQARAAAPDNPKVRFALAGVLASEGKLAEAIKELEGLAPQTRSPRIQVALAELYLRAKRPEEAVALLTTLTQRIPESPAPRFLLGQALLAINQPGRAVSEFT